MRNRNTMSPLEYIINSIMWAAVYAALYLVYLFTPVFGLSYQHSLIYFWSLMVLGLAVGIRITYRHRRNYVSLLTNTAMPLSIYFLFSFVKIIPGAVFLTLGIALGLGLVYCGILLLSWRQTAQTVPLKKCIHACLMGSRTIITLVLAVLVVGTAGKVLRGYPLVELPSNTAEVVSIPDKTTEYLLPHLDTLQLLQQEQWEELGVPERLQVMQTLADMEASYLGLPKVTVTTDILEEGTWGSYNHGTRTIKLSLGRLTWEDGYSMCRTLCHEIRHAYQHAAVDIYNALNPKYQNLLLLNETAQFSYEFKNYVDSSQNFQDYYDQLCEIDSRNYGEETAAQYFQFIQETLGASNEDYS